MNKYNKDNQTNKIKQRLAEMHTRHPDLAGCIEQLDIALELLLVRCENYDKRINQEIEDKDLDKPLSEWGQRIMRCRYVLGYD